MSSDKVYESQFFLVGCMAGLARVCVWFGIWCVKMTAKLGVCVCVCVCACARVCVCAFRSVTLILITTAEFTPGKKGKPDDGEGYGSG